MQSITLTVTGYDVLMGLLGVLALYFGVQYWSEYIKPKIIKRSTKVIEKNPKWITPKLRNSYYGFEDIDIYIAERATPFGHIPRVDRSRNTGFDLYIPSDASVNDVENIGKGALMAKIAMKYGIDVPGDKPLYWVSILCYMLDGGDIRQEATSWENTGKPE